MKVGRLLCALWACGPLTLGAGAAESPAHNGASAAVAHTNQASAGSAPDRNASVKTGRPATRESTHVGPGKVGGSTGRNAAGTASPRSGSATPQSGAAHAGRSSANGVLSLQRNGQARGRLAGPPTGRVGETRAVTHGPHESRAQGVTPAAQPKLAASKGTPTPAARLRPTAGNSAIGGPHAQALGRVGGPATGRATRGATGAAIDGTQLRHKF
jgi:hypothetical protein